MNNKNRYNNKKSYNKNERLRCDILFTENCTLACKYCYETRNRCCSKSTNMNFNTIRNAVDFAYNEARRLDYKNISFLIFGGEPLLNPDGVKYFAKYLTQKRKEYSDIKFYTSIITNGTIYDEDLLEYLLSLDKLFLRNIQVSIDGIPEVQDKNRPFRNGKGSTKVIAKNVKKYLNFFKKHDLDAYDMGFGFHSTFTRDVLPYLYESFVYCVETLKFPSGTITPVVEEVWTLGDEKILDEQLNKIFIKTQNEYKFKLPPIKPMDGKICCNAGKYQLAIAPNGDIFGCPRFYFSTKLIDKEYNKFRMGNVNQTPCLENKINPLDEARKEFDMCDTGNNCKICMGGNYEITGHLTSVISPFFGIIAQLISKYSRHYSFLIDKGIIIPKGGDNKNG